MNKNKLQLLSAALSLIFIFLLTSATSLAWYSMNKQDAGLGLQVSITDDSLYLSYSAYIFDEDLQQAKDVTTSLQSLRLPAYDSVILERNKNTALILRLDVYTKADVLETSHARCVLTCQDTSSTGTALSNIVYVKAAQLPTTATDAATIYLQACESLAAIDEKETFIKAGKKDTTISVDLSSFSPEGNHLIFYLEINYEPSLIEDLGAFNLDAFDLILNYSSDISKLEVIKE